ncbi:hypothetical protein DFR68_103258 [Nocardia mexicana]|uniref:Uncharacterized protein n=2 Tax=Nocardia mexicana TaxID=279262 RepID=A0A370H8A9_9NOCA|nr:hypothetical protein DFR68_103258 [Nocardia mexicana]
MDPRTSEVRRRVGRMGQFGELLHGGRLRKESDDEAGSGQSFEVGDLDLDRGVIRLNPRSEPAPRDESGE